MLRLMNECDIPDVARLHGELIPDALLPELGFNFMKMFYKTLLNLDSSIIYVWDENGKVKGFISAASDAVSIIKSAIGKNFILFLFYALIYIIKKPAKAVKLLETACYSKKLNVSDNSGELLFIALDMDSRKSDISDQLVGACLKNLKEKGIHKVRVMTGKNNKGANMLLKRQGFEISKELVFRGENVNLYTRAIY